MSTSEPLRTKNQIKRLKGYFFEKGELRNYALVTIGLNTALRIGDLLSLKWCDVYDFQRKSYYKHIYVTEQKTGKENRIYLNKESISALKCLFDKDLNMVSGDFIFKSRKGPNRPITRNRAFCILKTAGEELGLGLHFSCHSLRKTFGYHAWKNGVPPAVLMSIYNHSSFEVTKRYLSIDQDDKDQVFSSILL